MNLVTQGFVGAGYNIHRQTTNREDAHSRWSFPNKKKCTGFTMGISRGPLHWDNKDVTLSVR